jgi:hypothetical protein
MKQIFSILLLLQITFLGGCATQPTAKPAMKADSWPDVEQRSDDMGWWFVQFIKQWPEGDPAPFHYDVMLAEQVIRPTLARHHDKIALWRFHRRAGRDAAGSKFSFIFYANAQDARTITEQITADSLVTGLADNGFIEKIWIDDFTQINRPNVSDTSDAEWPTEIQNSWPYFIMGVSQSWLALIHEFTTQQPLDVSSASVEEIIEYYAGVTVDLDQYWKANGGHAYIHHLSGLFGYRPVEVRF